MITLYRSLFIVIFFVCFTTANSAELRRWTGSNGKTIEAEFVSYDPISEIVHLRLPNGKVSKVKLSLFSIEDQKFAKNESKETGDNPFGSESPDELPVASSTPIDMKFVLEETKKAVDRFEKKYPKPLPIGNLPTVYADLAVVQFYAGETEEAKKSLEKAKSLNESIIDEWSKNSNNNKIARIALEIGFKEIAKTIIDAMGNTNTNISFVLAFGDEADAMLAIAKMENPNAKSSGFIALGGEYLKKGNVGKAKELFDTAEKMGDRWSRNTIISKWLDANNVEEAQQVINRIDDDNLKARASASLAVHYLTIGDSKQMKQAAADSMLKVKDPVTKRSIVHLFYLAKDLETARKIKDDIIRESEAKLATSGNSVVDAFGIVRTYNQEMFWEGTPTVRQMVDRIEKMVAKKSGVKPASYLELYSQMIFASLVFDDSEYIADIIKKMEGYSQDKNDQRIVKARNNISDWYEYLGEIREGLPVLIKSGQSDRIIPILNRIKLPQGKIYTLRIIAETINDKKNLQ